jgi:hypothetical protein
MIEFAATQQYHQEDLKFAKSKVAKIRSKNYEKLATNQIKHQNYFEMITCFALDQY